MYIYVCVCAVQYGATWFGVSQGPSIGVSAKTIWILSNKIERCFTNKVNVRRQNAGSKVVKRNGVMSREMDGNGVSVQQQNLGSRQVNRAKTRKSRRELRISAEKNWNFANANPNGDMSRGRLWVCSFSKISKSVKKWANSKRLVFLRKHPFEGSGFVADLTSAESNRCWSQEQWGRTGSWSEVAHQCLHHAHLHT